MNAIERETVAAADPVRLPELVRSRVAHARRGLASVRILQSLCCALAVGIRTRAVGVRSGLAVAAAGLQIVALGNAALIGLGCALSFRRSPQQVARDIDLALDLRGALLTAWEVEGREQPTEIARRLGRDIASRVPARDMLRAVLPNAFAFLALPFLACALLFGVLEQARYGGTARDLAELTRQVEHGLASISEQNDAAPGDTPGSLNSLAPEVRKRLRALMADAAKLAERVRAGEAQPDDLKAMGDRLADFDTEFGGSDAQRRELDRAMSSIDSARMALEGRERVASGVESGEESQEGGNPGSDGRSLAPGGVDGRMSRPETPPIGRKREAEAGVLGLPSWPRAHESIVRRWVESARKSRSQR